VRLLELFLGFVVEFVHSFRSNAVAPEEVDQLQTLSVVLADARHEHFELVLVSCELVTHQSHDAFDPHAGSHGWNVLAAKHANKLVVPAAACHTGRHRPVFIDQHCLHNHACLVVQPSGQRQVDEATVFAFEGLQVAA